MNTQSGFLFLMLTTSGFLSIRAFYLPNYQSKKFNTCFEPFFPKECTCLNTKDLICEQFFTFSQLDFTQNNDINRAFESIKLRPSVSLKLDEKLNFTGIQLEPNALISLSDINLFSYLANPIKDLFQNEPIPRTLSLELTDSTLEFNYDNDLLRSRCSLQTIDQTKLPFFSSFNSLTFERVIFPLQVCPLIFLDSNIDELRFSSLSLTNSINFISISNTSRVNFNATVRRLEIQNSFIDRLDNNLLNKDVFFHLEELKLSDTILNHIEDNLFESFRSLKLILMYLENFSDFIQGNNTWMRSLTTNGQETIIGFIDSNKKYEYPEEDFCNFINFPHEKKVYPYIQTKSKLNCSSCTLAWLLQNWTQSLNSDLIKSPDSVYDCLNEQNINEFNMRIEECDFDSRIKVCLNIVDPIIPPPPEDYTILYVIIALVCMLCLIISIVVYFVVKRYKNTPGIDYETRLFNKYRNNFQQSEYDFGFCDLVQHFIRTEHSNPSVNVYRLPTSSGKRPTTPYRNERNRISYTSMNTIRPVSINLENFNNQIADMLNNRIISEVQPENIIGNIETCPIFFIDKKFQVDFTNLNFNTQLDGNSHLLTEDIKRRVLNANVFTILEFNSGAYQIKLEDGSKAKTIFQVKDFGYYQFEVMPMGLTNSRETFHRLMQTIISEFLDDFCFIYNGKLVVFSQSEEENFTHLNKVMDILSKNKLKLKRENCLFFQKEIILFKNLYKDHYETRNFETLSLIQNQIIKPKRIEGLEKILSLFELFKSDLDAAQFKLVKDLIEKFKTEIKWDSTSTKAFNDMKETLLNVLNLDLAELSVRENLILVINFTSTLYTCSLHVENQSGVSKPVAFCTKYAYNKSVNDRSVLDRVECVIWAIERFEPILFNKHFQVVFTFHFQIEQFELKVKNDPLWMSKIQGLKFSFVENLKLEKELKIMTKTISSALT